MYLQADVGRPDDLRIPVVDPAVDAAYDTRQPVGDGQETGRLSGEGSPV